VASQFYNDRSRYPATYARNGVQLGNYPIIVRWFCRKNNNH